MRTPLAVIVSLFVSALILGCDGASTESDSQTGSAQTASDPINEHCPIMGGKVTPEGGTVEWNGNTIGFCCEGCSEKWAALSDEEKSQALDEAEQTDANEDSETPQNSPAG